MPLAGPFPDSLEHRESARRSVERLAALEPDLVVPGNGRALRGPGMLEALRALARDLDQVAVASRWRYVDVPITADESGTVHVPPGAP
jgi:hypothetical protein